MWPPILVAAAIVSLVLSAAGCGDGDVDAEADIAATVQAPGRPLARRHIGSLSLGGDVTAQRYARHWTALR